MLFVGRLVPHKGILPLLETFRALLALDPSWGLSLVGAPADGSYGRLIRNYLTEHRAALNGRVALLHGLNNGALKSVYQRANLFVTLSEHEGFCVPLAEAMGFDLPIAVRAEPAMAEVLGDGGVLLNDTRPEDIARAIKRQMDDAQGLAQLAERRRQRYAELSDLAGGMPIWRAVEKALTLNARPL
jgi:glycosyltransferase involved in cell wall biosynthesis